MAERERSVLHEVEVLNTMQSRQLFNVRAFGSKLPDSGFEDLAEKVADACRGHPLALEVAGGFLRSKKNLESDKVLWDEMIAWKATRGDKLHTNLQISLEKGLDNCQKTMFLDIACLLIGEPSAIALEIWASCEYCRCGIGRGVHSSLRDLTEKCLVKVDTDGRLRMHDVLRDMGRGIVEAAVDIWGFTKWERTLFWDRNLADAVSEGRKVRGFSITGQYRANDTSIPTYDAGAFSKMSELHLLVLDGCLVSGDFSNWSRELRLLQWRFSSLSELPSELNLSKITKLDLSWSILLRRLWKDETPVTEAPINLRQLILKKCSGLTTLPQDIGKRLSKLKVLDLYRCQRLRSLRDSIGEMEDLEQLILGDCEMLWSIPDTVGRLKKLKHLDLSKLQVSGGALKNLGTLTALETLEMDNNKLIVYLPENFTGLTSLVRLNMNGCANLWTVNALPHSLRHLDLGRCWRLYQLPSLEGLTSLATLILEDCSFLKEIEGLECLTSLEEVNLRHCRSKQPVTLQLQRKRAMRSCCLSGSNVAVKYDNDWSKSKPALQLITYYDDTFGFLDHGLV